MPGKPCLGIRCLIKRLIEAKYRERQQPQLPPPPPRRREDPLEKLSPGERQRLLEAKSHAQLIASQLNLAAQEAKKKIEEYLRENNDPLVQLIYKEAGIGEVAGTGMKWTPFNIIAIALADAIEKGYHKDPEKLAKYILAYHTALTKNLQLPHPNTLKDILKQDPLVYRDELYALLHLEEVPSILGRALRHGEETKELGEKIYSEAREIERNWRYDLTVDPEEYARFRISFLKQQGIDITRELEEIERELRGEGVPEHTGARELLRMAIAEQLPGWVIKTALDQAKIPLYTSQEGIHPSIVKYHVQRADPADPKGTLLHGLITTILSEWEREITSGKQPSHPHETIKHLTGTDPTRELTEEEARRIAQSLGLPQNIAPKTLQRVLAELLRDLQELKNGKDPHLLDAEKEAALRYHQLRPLADNREPHPYIRRIILEGKQNILNVYQEIKNQVLAETQLGREEQEKTLNTLEKILRENLDQVITTGEPLTQTVAEITRRAEETLRREGIEDPQLRSWATNLLRNILLDAPIIAAARHPTVQYLPLDEKKRIAAALLQYYEKEAEKHSIAPVAADLHWMWEKVRKSAEGAEDPKRAMLETVERIRGAVNAMGNVTRLAYNMYRPLLNAENFAVEPGPGREGMLSHRVAMDLFNIKTRLIEGTFPRIKRMRGRP